MNLTKTNQFLYYYIPVDPFEMLHTGPLKTTGSFLLTFQSIEAKKRCLFISSTPSGPAPDHKRQDFTHKLLRLPVKGIVRPKRTFHFFCSFYGCEKIPPSGQTCWPRYSSVKKQQKRNITCLCPGPVVSPKRADDVLV